jgi:hypothetical protein
MRQLSGRISEIERKRKSRRDDDDPYPLVVYAGSPQHAAALAEGRSVEAGTLELMDPGDEPGPEHPIL